MFRINKGCENLERIYIMLSATDSVLSNAIGLVTQKKYNHISIALDKELHEIYSFGRLKPNNPIIGGFSCEDVTSDFYLKAECQIYELEITTTQLKNLRSNLSVYEKNKTHYHYNLLGLITAWAKIPWDREFAYFCSEFVSTLLIEAEILNTNLIPSITTPHDIIESLKLELIYEGPMWQYKLLDLPPGYIRRLKNFVHARII